jgi:hypothetical protein
MGPNEFTQKLKKDSYPPTKKATQYTGFMSQYSPRKVKLSLCITN